MPPSRATGVVRSVVRSVVRMHRRGLHGSATGGVSADGRHLWLSGRFDDVVYRFDTASGAVDVVAVGKEPHGLAVWPQPGRYSLGHTGNLR